MTEKLLRNGVTKVTEYVVMCIDQYGDSGNADACDDLQEGKETFEKEILELNEGISDEVKAIVLEKRIQYFPWDHHENVYKVLKTYGCKKALKLGGWIS